SLTEARMEQAGPQITNLRYGRIQFCATPSGGRPCVGLKLNMPPVFWYRLPSAQRSYPIAMDSRAAAPGSINSVAAPDTAPAAGAHAETARKHQVEEAKRLIAAFECDIDDFGLSGGQQFAGAREAQLGVLLAKGHAYDLIEEPV